MPCPCFCLETESPHTSCAVPCRDCLGACDTASRAVWWLGSSGVPAACAEPPEELNQHNNTMAHNTFWPYTAYPERHGRRRQDHVGVSHATPAGAQSGHVVCLPLAACLVVVPSAQFCLADARVLGCGVFAPLSSSMDLGGACSCASGVLLAMRGCAMVRSPSGMFGTGAPTNALASVGLALAPTG